MKIEEIKYGTCGIYKMIFNNDKIYIGLSNDIRRRINEHMNKDIKEHPELPVNKALVKYGLKDIEILEILDSNNRKLLQEREQYWIQYYNSFLDKTIGYNLIPGGDGAQQGILNSASYISEEKVNNIIKLLQESNLTYEDIAKQNGCSYTIISRINNGVHYRKDNIQYPIREKRNEHYGIENKTSAFYNNEDKLLSLIEDLKNNILSQKELCEKYNLGKQTITKINSGKIYTQDNEKYPLRPLRENCSHKRVFSENELNTIIQLLQTKETMANIAKKFACDRKVISDINQGKRQPVPNLVYPIRKTKK